MFSSKRFNLHRDESGQTALETAIILIAFVVVASVFAFTILSAGQASTAKGEQAIYSGLKGVESSMAVKGSVILTATGTNVVFDLALVSGGDPVDLTPPGSSANNKVVINYRTAAASQEITDWTVSFLGNQVTADDILQAGELAEVTVPAPTALTANTEFTLEVKPPTGGVLVINRTTPAAIDIITELR